jgi:PadR family transcriptional regulator, regulatory protein AphA
VGKGIILIVIHIVISQLLIIAMNQTTPLTEYGLLGFVRARPRHGYAIHQELSNPAGLGPVWQIKRSQLYALLHKLEEAGYLASSIEPQGSSPPRKLFHLTDAGRDAFLDWLEQPVPHGRYLRLEFLVKLYFARQEGAAVAARLLAAQQAAAEKWLAAQKARLAAEAENGRDYGRLVHLFRLGQIQAMLVWLETRKEEWSDES